MTEENASPQAPAVGYQIFHELGKLSSACDAIVRDMAGMRVELNTRSEQILRQLGEHTKDDATNFAVHAEQFKGDDDRLKSLEQSRATLKGFIIATNVLWVVVTGVLILWFSYKPTGTIIERRVTEETQTIQKPVDKPRKE